MRLRWRYVPPVRDSPLPLWDTLRSRAAHLTTTGAPDSAAPHTMTGDTAAPRWRLTAVRILRGGGGGGSAARHTV